MRLHVVDGGDPSGPPVMLVQGPNGHAHFWDPVSEVLMSEYRVIRPALLGHGDSDWAFDGYLYASFGHDLHDLAREL